MNRKLIHDALNMETVCEETANRREMRYIYAIAVAVLHILEWIERKERNEQQRP